VKTVVRDNADDSRYELWLDGRMIGVAEYVVDADERIFTHTEIDADLRDRGYASELIEGALDDMLRHSTQRVVAECPFVREWLDEHPDYSAALTANDV
jgi:uncharacterized protein